MSSMYAQMIGATDESYGLSYYGPMLVHLADCAFVRRMFQAGVKDHCPGPWRSLEERTVKQLRLTKALTLPEATAVSEACRRMAARRADAALLTDAKGVLSGIVTAEDILGRVIAEGLIPNTTSVSKVMTRNPVFVMSNSSATEALQKMVQGKFRHLPVVEHGEVIAMLDITKFLYDAISRMEKAAEQGSAIAAAMERVERQWGNEFAGPHTLIENLRDHMFKPSLSTIITENSSVASVSPSDLVIVAAKKMREYRVNSVVVMTGNMLQGILTTITKMLSTLQFQGFGFASSGTKSVPRGDSSRKVSKSLDELVSAIAYILGTENKKANVNLLYDDDEGDRVLLATDGDLVAAIEHARSAGWKECAVKYGVELSGLISHFAKSKLIKVELM
ncbi:Meiotically up-regulated gene 70 protein [Triticum urartu]|uniref:Meiotically up-regulated gene 70 protein n=1 Tax=Triticum urartu TaxID=4572 RepID=M7YJE2_TRIUA|nr:Meiotically up-regulated gene 70 protein [Triticum urartu]